MEKIYGKYCVKEAFYGLLADLFLQCSADKSLAATLETKCNENGIESDHCHQEEKIVDLFKKLKQRRIIEEDNVEFLKQVVEADHREDLKKRIEQFEEGKWQFAERYEAKSSEGIKFRWPETLDYGSNSLLQVLLQFVQYGEHLNDSEKRALYIYCDDIIEPSLDFSCYTRDPFRLIEKLMDHEIIGPRNLDFLKRFFSLKTVRKPNKITILERFEAGAFIKQALARYSGCSPKSTGEVDEPLSISWMETTERIKKLMKKSFKGSKRLDLIRDLLKHIQQLESGEDRHHKLLTRLIEEACLAEEGKQWQPILKLLVVSGEFCRLAEPQCFEIARISRAIGVFSPLGQKITIEMDALKTFLKEKEVLLNSSCVGRPLGKESEREAVDKMIFTAWQKYKQREEKDEDDDIEMLNGFFKDILLFH